MSLSEGENSGSQTLLSSLMESSYTEGQTWRNTFQFLSDTRWSYRQQSIHFSVKDTNTETNKDVYGFCPSLSNSAQRDEFLARVNELQHPGLDKHEHAFIERGMKFLVYNCSLKSREEQVDDTSVEYGGNIAIDNEAIVLRQFIQILMALKYLNDENFTLPLDWEDILHGQVHLNNNPIQLRLKRLENDNVLNQNIAIDKLNNILWNLCTHMWRNHGIWTNLPVEASSQLQGLFGWMQCGPGKPQKPGDILEHPFIKNFVEEFDPINARSGVYLDLPPECSNNRIWISCQIKGKQNFATSEDMLISSHVVEISYPWATLPEPTILIIRVPAAEMRRKMAIMELNDGKWRTLLSDLKARDESNVIEVRANIVRPGTYAVLSSVTGEEDLTQATVLNSKEIGTYLRQYLDDDDLFKCFQEKGLNTINRNYEHLKLIGQEDFKVMLRSFKMEDSMVEKFLRKIKDHETIMTEIPQIVAERGEEAIQVYEQALKDGYDYDKRVMIMFVGHQGVGKTSLKNAFLGRTFNPSQPMTESLELDLGVVIEHCNHPWKQVSPKGVEHPRYDEKLANYIVRQLHESNTIPEEEDVSLDINENVEEERGSEGDFVRNDDDCVMSRETGNSFEPLTWRAGDEHLLERNIENDNERRIEEENAEKIGHSEHENRTDVQDKLKNQIPKAILRQLSELSIEDHCHEEIIEPILVDFAGQELFYNTHPVFLNDKAIYVLVYNINCDLQDKSIQRAEQNVSSQPVSEEETNWDSLLFWLSLIHALNDTKVQPKHGDTQLHPPVILVCTHADQDRHTNYLKMFNSFQAPYRDHLVEDIFLVDNTKAGNEQECPDLTRLRKTLINTASKLPHLKNKIPLKWLCLEKCVKLLVEDGNYYIQFSKLREDARESCDIVNDLEFINALGFLHDRGIVLYFQDTEELRKIVFLDYEWLVGVFKEVFTLPTLRRSSRDDGEDRMAWKELEDHGTLQPDFIRHNLMSHATKSGEEDKDNFVECLISLMEHFTLICKWVNPDGSYVFVIPSVLTSAPDVALLKSLSNLEPKPIFISFKSGYVPFGLFPRLVIRILDRCMITWTTHQPKLRHRFASIFIGNFSEISLVLVSTLHYIKVAVVQNHTSEQDTSLVDKFALCQKVLLFLKDVLGQMKHNYHWLHNMEYTLSLKCSLCRGTFKSGGRCKRHGKDWCQDDSCAHFIELPSSSTHQTVQCENTKLNNKIQVDSEWCDVQDNFSQDKDFTNVLVSEQCCRDLSSEVGEPHWKHLLAELRIEQHKIQTIQSENAGSVREMIYQGLMVWFDKRGGPALEFTVGHLASVLESIGLLDVATKLRNGSIFNNLPQDPRKKGVYDERQVDELLCHRVATRVASHWKWLLRYLGLPECQVRNNDQEGRGKNWSIVDMCCNSLLTWKRNLGLTARWWILRDALSAIGQQRAAHEIEKECFDECFD